MGRRAKPWYRKQDGFWYVYINGQAYKLSEEQEEAEDKFHELMLNRRELKPHRFVCDLLDEFLDWTQKRRAPLTYDWYKGYLSSFAASVGKRLSVAELKPHHVTKWIDTDYPDSSDTTKGSIIKAVQRAFNWGIKQGYIRLNPLVGIEKPAATRREIVITEKQHKKILAKAGDEAFRELLTVLWETGCRPQEIVRVTSEDVDLKGKRWIFPPSRSKGKKSPRVVYLNEKAFAITKKLIDRHPDGTLFRNSQGRAWNKNSVRCRFRRLGIKIKGLCAYAYRHTWATRALQNGVDPITCSVLMGHVDLTTLSRTYAHLSRNPKYLHQQVRKATT